MDWKDCLKKRIVKDIKVDNYMINSLIKSSNQRTNSQKRLEIDYETANSKISLAYDSLRELLEALAIKQGFKIYNHECYTYFLKEILKESQKAEEFDELRKIRNGLNYYAEEVSLDEAKEILIRLGKLREEIFKLI